ncbi:VOC family protein [Agrococcus sp. Marseille-P2731]|uniref:VOC family protein n=1 Tax=Agrococcus sp. Marseille-P2731 TaxID=1841862 RepID=UPI00093124FC|nr:VOC family protein [Agrococcus sp. Marseille-P2731]
MDVSTCLWFDGRIEEAAEFYVSLLPGSSVGAVTRYPDPNPFPSGAPGDAVTIELTLAGTRYMLLNGGPMFPLSEAVSIVLVVDGQEEVDRLWDALTADGGAESQCGWCKDRFGLSWQVIPRRYLELAAGPNAAAVEQAMSQMQKLDVSVLEAAATG